MVDNGCGNGAFAIAAAEQFPGCSVFAFDGLQSAVDECTQRAGPLLQQNLSVRVACADALLLENDVADRALSRFVLHHIKEPEAMFRELKRVLRPGGLLLLQTPCNVWDASMAEILRETFLAMDESHSRFYYHPEEILERLKRCGFTLELPELQKFRLPGITQDMVNVIQQRGVADQLRLRPVNADFWEIELTWIRVVAQA